MSLAWLNELLQIFFGLLPRPKIIRTDQELIEFRLGRYPRVLGAGWYIEWPLFAEYEVIPIRRDVVSREQKFRRDDGLTDAFRWKIVYQICDSLALASETYDYSETIADFGEIEFAKAYEQEADPISRESQEVVLETLKVELEAYGVEVLDFVITSSTTSHSYSLWELTNFSLGTE